MAVLPIAWIAARRLTRPVRALASAVASLDLHGDGPPAPLEGPAEIQAAAAAFNAMRNRIRAQANERTRMVAAIAHDLRTPLTGLRLRAESAPPGVRDRMAVDIRRMDAMITQILDFARAEASTPAAECVDVRQLVQEAVDAARENGGDVETALPDRLVTRGDAIMLRRAVDNLLNNAIRYGGRAHVALEEAPGGWSIAIQDHGPGVPEEQLDRLGDPFHRVEFSRNATTGGIGLGLSIAKTAARLHGGRLEFMNRPTGGLRVVLSARSSER
ncbi:MAG: sensor histidine kinase [Lysobacteraceae bacterium]